MILPFKFLRQRVRHLAQSADRVAGFFGPAVTALEEQLDHRREPVKAVGSQHPLNQVAVLATLEIVVDPELLPVQTAEMIDHPVMLACGLATRKVRV